MATTSKPKTSRRRSLMMSGFDSLTLDPSPRLRRAREELSQPREAVIVEAWRSVARALGTAVSSVSDALKADL